MRMNILKIDSRWVKLWLFPESLKVYIEKISIRLLILGILLSDFGFAKIYKEGSVTQTICGSPLYMAPEILTYKKYLPENLNNIKRIDLNNFNFRLIDQGPLEGLYVTELSAVVYSKSGDFIQHKSIGGRYYLMQDYESISYYSVSG